MDSREAIELDTLSLVRVFLQFLERASEIAEPFQPADLQESLFLDFYQALPVKRLQKYEYYMDLRRVLAHLRIVQPEDFHLLNVPLPPDGKPARRHRAPMSDEVVIRVLKVARGEAESAWAQFIEGQGLIADAEKRFTLAEVAALKPAAMRADLGAALLHIRHAYSGLLPYRGRTSPERNFCHSVVWRLGGVEHVMRYLHLTNETLVPYLVLLLQATAANPEGFLQMRRDCMRQDPVFPHMIHVAWDKPRGHKRRQSKAFDRRKRGSAPQLIERVLDMTAPLQDHVAPAMGPAPDERQKLFLTPDARRCLAPGTRGAGNPPYAYVHRGLENFLGRNGLEGAGVVFSAFRITKMQAAWRMGLPLHVIKQDGGWAQLQSAIEYVEDEARLAAPEMIALAHDQGLFTQPYIRNPTVAVRQEAGPAARPGLVCADPTNGKGPGSHAGELCPQWLKDLLDPSLVILAEDRYVARLLRTRDDLLSLRESMQSARWKFLYGGYLAGLDEALAKVLDADLLRRGLEQSGSLPSAIGVLPR